VLFDSAAAYEEARVHLEHSMPQSLPKLKLYQDPIPLFSHFHGRVADRERAMTARCRCLRAGAIVIDHSRGADTIDVNRRAHRGALDRDTATQTNLEAADEVARQLRLRDLGGLLVIDFIDMESPRTSARSRTSAALRHRPRASSSGPSPDFGLLEMSRQRMQPSLGEHTQIPSHAARPRQIRASALALRPAHHRGRGDEGEHRARDRAAPRRRRHVPAHESAPRWPPSRRATTST